MPYFVDSGGRLWEFDPQDVGELDRLSAEGYAPATEDDIRRHNHQLEVGAAEASSTPGEAMANAAGRVYGGATELLSRATTGLGLPDAEVIEAEQAAPESFSDRARLVAEARPYSTMAGQGAATLLPALATGGLAGAAAGAAGAGALATTGAAVVGEAGLEAVAQEYEDAWLQQREMTMKGVVANTLLFATGDVMFRGLVGAGGHLLKNRNLLAEARGRAAKASPAAAREARSVGAASPKDFAEDVGVAIREMNDHDAVVLDRDADDYFKLTSVSATDSMNRIQGGLENELSYAAKVEDWEAGADLWTGRNRAEQEKAVIGLQTLLAPVDAELRKHAETGYRFGAAGQRVRDLLEMHWERIEGAEGAARNQAIDYMKRGLDKEVLRLRRSARRSADEEGKLKLAELVEGYSDKVREKLHNVKAWGRNAQLQKAVNPGWSQFLDHWSAVDRKLFEATGATDFGTGRRIQEATTRKMHGVMSDNPVLNREFLQHLEGALDGLEMMIGARQSFGLSRLDPLDELRDNLATLARDFNVAHAIGAAQARVKHLKKSPGTWVRLMAEVAAQRAPFGVGATVQAIGKYLQHTRIKKGTPLARVMDDALARYAKHPMLADDRIAADFPPWMREALGEAGKPTTPTPSPAAPAAARPEPPAESPPGAAPPAEGGMGMDDVGRVASVGLFAAGAGAAASSEDQDVQAAAAGGLGLLAAFAGRGRVFGRDLADKLARDLPNELSGPVQDAYFAHRRELDRLFYREASVGVPGQQTKLFEGRFEGGPGPTRATGPKSGDELVDEAVDILAPTIREALPDAPREAWDLARALAERHFARHADARLAVGRYGQKEAARLPHVDRQRVGKVVAAVEKEQGGNWRGSSFERETFEGQVDAASWYVHRAFEETHGRQMTFSEQAYARWRLAREMRAVKSETPHRLSAREAQNLDAAITTELWKPLEGTFDNDETTQAAVDFAKQYAKSHGLPIGGATEHARKMWRELLAENTVDIRTNDISAAVDRVVTSLKSRNRPVDAESIEESIEALAIPRSMNLGDEEREWMANYVRKVVPAIPEGTSPERLQAMHDALDSISRTMHRAEAEHFRNYELDYRNMAREVDSEHFDLDLTEAELDYVEARARAIHDTHKSQAVEAEAAAEGRGHSVAAESDAFEAGIEIPEGFDLGFSGDGGNVSGIFNGAELDADDVKQLLGLDYLKTLRGSFELYDDTLSFQGTTAEGIQLQRIWQQDGYGLHVSHEYFVVPKEYRGESLGVKVIATMFDAYERFDVDRVSVSTMDVGNWLWPHLGFEANSGEMRLMELKSALGDRWGDHIGGLDDQLDETFDLVEFTNLTVPVEAIPDAMLKRFKESLSGDDYEKFYLTKDKQHFKLAKYYMIGHPGSPGSYHIELDSERYRDIMRKQLGLAGTAAALFSAEELFRALEQTKLTGTQKEEPEQSYRLNRALGGGREQGRSAAPNFSLFDQAPKPAGPTTASLEHARALRLIDKAGRATLKNRAAQLVKNERAKKSRGAVATFQGKAASMPEALKSKRKRLSELINDPEKLLRELGPQMGELPRTHPTVYTGLVARLVQVAGYLQTELPRAVGRTLLNPDGIEPSVDEVREFAYKYSGAADPDGALRDIASGRSHPAQVGALKANWPELFEQFRIDVMGELVSLGQRGKKVPVERMRALDDVLELDGAANVVFGWSFAQRVEEARALNPQQGAPPESVPQTASTFQTRAQGAATMRNMA